MKLIDLSGITATTGYPGLANNPSALVGLDFLQEAYKDLFAKCAQSVSLTGNPTMLEGLFLSGNNISAGGMYYNGEIFLYNGGNISGLPGIYISCSWVPNPTDTGANKTVLSDGSAVSIHNQRTLSFTYSLFPNAGNLPDYNTWVQNQVTINTAAINTLQSQILTPYSASDRVASGNIPISETVLHSLTVTQNINNLLIAVSMEIGNVTVSQTAITVKIYVGGSVTGHTAGTISGSIAGGTIVKQTGGCVDDATNITDSINAMILTNVTAGQSVTVTIIGGQAGPVVENSSDLVLSGMYN